MNHTTIISARWVVTVNEGFDVLSDSSVIVINGRIDSILANHELSARDDLSGAEHIQLGNHVLMPGLVNAHTHAAMSLLRGIADDLPLMDWLQNHIWPAESKWVDREFIRDGIALAAAEMLRGGTTCFNDMYFFPDDMARTCQKLGIRAVAGLIVLDFPTIWARDANDYLSKALAVNDELKELSLVSCALAPHAPYTVSDAPLEKVAMYSSELDLPVHMHVHETQHEVDEAVKNSGKRPLERLDQLGLLNPNLVAVHMTALNDMEIERIAETGVNIAHCPESNMKLASGFCPVHALNKRGINTCLGTDGAASNNDLDMFGEMRSAALLAKAVAADASACNAEQAIRMATINGARALGLGDSIGSIEVGKKADLIGVDLSHLATQPVYDPVAQLVYASNSLQVSHVWVDGVPRVADYQLADDIDAVDIITRAQHWQHKIQQDS
jgi:5-methylthioadenosine/S-adenosylhomocysteine deaminase